MSLALERSYWQAEAVTAWWAKSFHFASRFLPRPKRRAIFALYDFCRHADNLVDECGLRSADLVRRDLASLAAEVSAMHGGASPAPRWLALGDTLRRYPVPLEPLLELLDGVAMDLGPVEVQTWDELHEYCRLVAGGVGLMVGPVLGASSPEFREAGVRLGIAMQLTNILRDVGDDLGSGRVYLPAQELAQGGLDRAVLERAEVTLLFQHFMAFQVARARRYFEAGDVVVPLFPDDGSRLTVRLLQRTYAGILDAIERNGYDVFRRRACVSAPRKLLILGRAMLTGRPGLLGRPEEGSI